VVDEAEGGFASEGELFGVESVTGLEVGVFVEEAAVLGAEIEAAAEVQIDACTGDTGGTELHGGDAHGEVAWGVIDGGGAAVDGQEGEEARADITKEREALVDAGACDVGDGGLVHVGVDVEFAVVVVVVVDARVEIVLRDSGVAKVDGVAEPGAEGLAEGAERADGGCGALHGEAEGVLRAVDGELREDAKGEGRIRFFGLRYARGRVGCR